MDEARDRPFVPAREARVGERVSISAWLGAFGRTLRAARALLPGAWILLAAVQLATLRVMVEALQEPLDGPWLVVGLAMVVVAVWINFLLEGALGGLLHRDTTTGKRPKVWDLPHGLVQAVRASGTATLLTLIAVIPLVALLTIGLVGLGRYVAMAALTVYVVLHGVLPVAMTRAVVSREPGRANLLASARLTAGHRGAIITAYLFVHACSALTFLVPMAWMGGASVSLDAPLEHHVVAASLYGATLVVRTLMSNTLALVLLKRQERVSYAEEF